MPRKKKKEEEQHRRIRPVHGSKIRTIHVDGWENEYRNYCVQPEDKKQPEMKAPTENPYNKSHGSKRHQEPAKVDPAIAKASAADWRQRRVSTPPVSKPEEL